MRASCRNIKFIDISHDMREELHLRNNLFCNDNSVINTMLANKKICQKNTKTNMYVKLVHS